MMLTFGYASAQKQAKIKFDKTTYNFGDFSEKSPIQKCTFTFTNVGDAPLIINQATASCGCTIPKYTKKPVLSEAFIKNILTVYYNIPNPTICKTIHGKPYLLKSKICFNLTHSKGLTALAVGRRGAVGFDCEDLTGKARPAVLAKLIARERGEISSTRDF